MRREIIERKPYVAHDPDVGYRYVPSTEMRLPAPDDRWYVLRTNSAGIRSDRDYAPAKPPGMFRALVLGDSLTAGQYVDNAVRFTDRLERLIPGTEFMNLALEGTGTDQQLRLLEHFAARYEHDAVLLCPYLENIRRNVVRYRLSVDLQSNRWVLTPKPRLVEGPDGRWEWEGIPVSKERPLYEEAGPDLLRLTDFGGSGVADPSIFRRLKGRLNSLLEITRTKGPLYRLTRHEPFQEYRKPGELGWRTMRAILERFQSVAGERKLVVAPLVPMTHLLYEVSTTYRRRFSEACPLMADILPHLRRLHSESRRRCYIPGDAHLSEFGHEQVARALEAELKRLGVP